MPDKDQLVNLLVGAKMYLITICKVEFVGCQLCAFHYSLGSRVWNLFNCFLFCHEKCIKQAIAPHEVFHSST